MSEVKRIHLALNLTKLGEAVKTGHKSVFVSQKGEKFVNLVLWLNEPDAYKNDVGAQLSRDKDSSEKPTYVGSGKTDVQMKALAAQPAPVVSNIASDVSEDSLPF